MMKSFWLCLQFFTRFPTPQYVSVSAVEMGRGLAWFPVVGGLIGGCLVMTAFFDFWLPERVTAIFVLAVWVWTTGALHLDGLADTADGWLGGVGSHQRALEIMKDSRIGTGGGVALGLALLFKWVLLSELLEGASGGLLWIGLSPILARVASLIYLKTTEYVSESGLGEQMFAFLSSTWVWVWGILAFACVLLSFWFLLLVPVWFWVRWVAQNITGGMTGDTAGAMTEVMEISVLLIGVIVLSGA